MQQKIVEAAMKLSSAGDLCKTVKKKRRNNCLDAMRKLEEIEKEINAYRTKKGKKPTQRASLILAGRNNGTEDLKQAKLNLHTEAFVFLNFILKIFLNDVIIN